MESFVLHTFQSESAMEKKRGSVSVSVSVSPTHGLILMKFKRKCLSIEIVQSLFILFFHVYCSILLKSWLTEVDQMCTLRAIHTIHWPSTRMQEIVLGNPNCRPSLGWLGRQVRRNHFNFSQQLCSNSFIDFFISAAWPKSAGFEYLSPTSASLRCVFPLTESPGRSGDRPDYRDLICHEQLTSIEGRLEVRLIYLISIPCNAPLTSFSVSKPALAGLQYLSVSVSVSFPLRLRFNFHFNPKTLRP